MVQPYWSPKAFLALGSKSFSQIMTSILFAGFFLLFATGATKNPDDILLGDIISPKINPTLSFSGTDVIITGSISHVFASSVFSGPNRSLKISRTRPKEDILEFTRKFASARLQIAALRNKQNKNNATQVRLANNDKQKQQILSSLSVAGIDSGLMSAALEAIEKADSSTSQNIPAPIAISQRLAYVRANQPATNFSTPTSMSVSKKQLQCLATAIYFEARGEPYRGQIGVAQVVMNRVKHKLYPNTICSVVYQNQNRRNACQFSFACDGIRDRINEKQAWEQAKDIAKKVTSGELYLAEVANATHYHATYVNPKWAKRMKRLTQIGIHRFYRFKKGWNWS